MAAIKRQQKFFETMLIRILERAGEEPNQADQLKRRRDKLLTEPSAAEKREEDLDHRLKIREKKITELGQPLSEERTRG